MAKEVVVNAWCDAHLGDSDGVVRVPGKPHTITVDDVGPLELDLCDEHVAALVRPLLDAVLAWGAPQSANLPGAQHEKTRHQCRICDKTAPSRSALGTHYRTEHDTTLDDVEGTTTIRCTECGKGYGRVQGVMQHMRNAHGMETQAVRDALAPQRALGEPAASEVACPKCGKGFDREGKGNDSLSRHLGSTHKIRGEARIAALKSLGMA